MKKEMETEEQSAIPQDEEEAKKCQKLNCWEFKKCGREPGGAKANEIGVCPASIDASSSGINSGRNSGRICWATVGTFCGGKIQGSFAMKRMTCLNCKFFKTVMEEEGIEEFVLTKTDQDLR